VELAAQRVSQHEARLAEARQNVLVLEADVDVAGQKVVKAQSELAYGIGEHVQPKKRLRDVLVTEEMRRQ
jgi:hypothetical protein